MLMVCGGYAHTYTRAHTCVYMGTDKQIRSEHTIIVGEQSRAPGIWFEHDSFSFSSVDPHIICIAICVLCCCCCPVVYQQQRSYTRSAEPLISFKALMMTFGFIAEVLRAHHIRSRAHEDDDTTRMHTLQRVRALDACVCVFLYRGLSCACIRIMLACMEYICHFNVQVD